MGHPQVSILGVISSIDFHANLRRSCRLWQSKIAQNLDFEIGWLTSIGTIVLFQAYVKGT